MTGHGLHRRDKWHKYRLKAGNNIHCLNGYQKLKQNDCFNDLTNLLKMKYSHNYLTNERIRKQSFYSVANRSENTTFV